MSLTLRAAREGDLDGFTIDARQASLFQGNAFDTLHRLVASGSAIAAVWRDRVIGFGGLAEYWPGRAGAWCFLRAGMPKAAWVPLTRAVRVSLAAAKVRRIEADVRCDFRAGGRWARLLGFEYEGVMRRYWIDGADYRRFARIVP